LNNKTFILRGFTPALHKAIQPILFAAGWRWNSQIQDGVPDDQLKLKPKHVYARAIEGRLRNGRQRLFTTLGDTPSSVDAGSLTFAKLNELIQINPPVEIGGFEFQIAEDGKSFTIRGETVSTELFAEALRRFRAPLKVGTREVVLLPNGIECGCVSLHEVHLEQLEQALNKAASAR
jgi:hypothetical protein